MRPPRAAPTRRGSARIPDRRRRWPPGARAGARRSVRRSRAGSGPGRPSSDRARSWVIPDRVDRLPAPEGSLHAGAEHHRAAEPSGPPPEARPARSPPDGGLVRVRDRADQARALIAPAGVPPRRPSRAAPGGCAHPPLRLQYRARVPLPRDARCRFE